MKWHRTTVSEEKGQQNKPVRGKCASTVGTCAFAVKRAFQIEKGDVEYTNKHLRLCKNINQHFVIHILSNIILYNLNGKCMEINKWDCLSIIELQVGQDEVLHVAVGAGVQVVTEVQYTETRYSLFSQRDKIRRGHTEFHIDEAMCSVDTMCVWWPRTYIHTYI